MQAMHLHFLDCCWKMSQNHFLQSIASNPGELDISHQISGSWLPPIYAKLRCDWLRTPQAAPPLDAVDSTVRLRLCVPKPQRDKRSARTHVTGWVTRVTMNNVSHMPFAKPRGSRGCKWTTWSSHSFDSQQDNSWCCSPETPCLHLAQF